MNLGLGLGLPFAYAQPWAGVWTPATLFSAGEQGAWYDPSDFSTMFQDSAGTTPVTAVGQPVGRILDKSGRGNHATQTTATSRPVLQQDGNGKYYLAFDGVDDWMITSAITPGTDKAQFFAGLEKLSDAAFQVIAETGTGAQTGTISLSASLLRGTRQSWAVGVLGTTSCLGGAYGLPAPDKRVLTALLDIAGSTSTEEVRLRLNGVRQTLNYASTPSAGTGVLGTYPLYIGRRSSGAFPFSGRFYGLIVRFGAQPHPQTIADTEDWLNQRMA